MATIIHTGEPGPDFSLKNSDGAPIRLSDLRGQIVLLYFWSAECPWVERCDLEIATASVQWGEAVKVLLVASNKNEPPNLLYETAAKRGLPKPLHDPDQQLADLYGVQITPHLFLIDAQGNLRYQGAVDDVTFRKRTPTRNYLREAVAALLEGRQPDPEETPPYGCAIVRDV